MRRLLLTLLLLFCAAQLPAQDFTSDFKPLKDTLTTLSCEHFAVKSQIEVWRVMRRGKNLDIYFSRHLSDYPWRTGDAEWFRNTLKEFWPENLSAYKLGEVFCRSTNLKDLITPGPGNSNGKPQNYKFSFLSHKTGSPFIEKLKSEHPKKGLYRRNIALWQSHGLYFDGNFWSWQRPPTWRTVEDLYTQSYVLPFLIPMLENAGAYVMTPRERDSQILEIICDNDPHFTYGPAEFESSDRAMTFSEPLPVRKHGGYDEKGAWSSAGEGFADFKQIYTNDDNPFLAGTARKTDCVHGKGKAKVRWTPVFEKRGHYAVYISYKTLPESTNSAHYTVHHMGGESEFAVDQSKGGGTWIYLGTFEFGEGSDGYVELDNGTPSGHKGGKTVTADAVRFGGGIGKLARGKGDVPDSTWTVSGMPSHTEGALYQMQYSGAPQRLWKEWDGDYTRDYAGRGAWVKWMKDDLGIPIDLSLAFHTDAGTTPNDSIVGTLCIYTLLEKGSSKFKNGQSRMASRFLADCIQSEVTATLQRDYDSLWRRRQLWDRSYSECRTTDVPGIIFELLSHQNFADMKYGQDPQFRFDASRSVYKGIVKFLSTYYGTSYVIQPLPVTDFAAEFEGNGHVRLRWRAVSDINEPTAEPDSYLIYTRVDGGAWGDGLKVKECSLSLPIEEGHIYSYKVVAVNDGGCSFPSEILSVGVPPASKGKVLIVNNFNRVSGPSFFDTPDYAGFDDKLDSGVPWGSELSFIGEDYENRRDKAYAGNNAPSFGASDYYFAGRSYMGNTFDYPYLHGKALFDLGYSFCSASSGSLYSDSSASSDKLSADSLASSTTSTAYSATSSTSSADTSATSSSFGSAYYAIDVICGKQVSTIVGTGQSGIKYMVFPKHLRDFLKSSSQAGTHLIVSGANIATDGWDSVYPIKDSCFTAYQQEARDFISNTLGYKWISSRASRDGIIVQLQGEGSFEIHNSKNSDSYCVENPDGIRPNDSKGEVALKYRSSNIGAGVFYNGNGYKAASYGFPLETLKSPQDLKNVLEETFKFFRRQ